MKKSRSLSIQSKVLNVEVKKFIDNTKYGSKEVQVLKILNEEVKKFKYSNYEV